MSQFSAHEWLKVVEAIEPGDHVGGAPTADYIDAKGFEEALLILHVATVAGSSPTIDIQMQESDASGSGYADITSAAFAQLTASNDETVYVGRLNLRIRKRYIKADITHGGTPSEASYGMTCVLAGAKIKPVTPVNAASFAL